MTQTIEEMARELLAVQLDIGLYHDDAERIRTAQDGLGVICAASAIAALTEALTREAEAVAKVGDRDDTIRNMLNERRAYDARIEELEGVLINIGEVDDDGFTSDGNERCAERAHAALTKGIRE